MKHEMKLKEIYFNKIKSGDKIYEIRLNDEKRKLIKEGDIIIFKKEPDLIDYVEVEVEQLLRFSSFAEMLNSLSLKNIGFEGATKEDVEKIYHSFYSVETEKQFGVLAINVKTI